MFRRLILPVLCAVAIIALCGFGPRINVMSIGDSWSAGWNEDMEAEILSHGTLVTAHNLGIVASTADLWANPDTLFLANAQIYLLQNPDIEWVVISLGGNDLLDGYLLGPAYGDAIFDYIDPDVRVVLDGLLTVRPTLKIFLNGYDFLNFEQSLFCVALGQAALGGTTYTQNILLSRLRDLAAEIAADYPQVYAVDTIGALQEAGGVPDFPNYLLPSPAWFFPIDDCIHPSANGGYRVLMSRIYDGFFGPLNEPTTTTTTTTTTTSTSSTTTSVSTTSTVSATSTVPPSDDDADDDWFVDDDAADDDASDDDSSDDDSAAASADAGDDDDDDGCGC